MTTADEPDLRIAWREGLSVGNAEIDGEHMDLIRRVNNLNAALVAQAGQEEILHLMQRLLDAAKAHFAREELLMHASRYPEVEQHRLIHARLTADFAGAMDNFVGTTSTLTWLAKGLLISSSLMEHLGKEDMKYRDFLNPDGI